MTDKLDSMVDEAKAELDALEAAFAKKSERNALAAVKSGVRAGVSILPPKPQPLYGVVLPPGKPFPHPVPLYGVFPPGGPWNDPV